MDLEVELIEALEDIYDLRQINKEKSKEINEQKNRLTRQKRLDQQIKVLSCLPDSRMYHSNKHEKIARQFS